MKSSNSNTTEETSKISQSRSSKKSNKSRSKSNKSEPSGSGSGNIKNSFSTVTSGNSISAISSNINAVTTPTTPTTSTSNYNIFDASFAGATDAIGNSNRSHTKSYAGLEPRSVKIMWEQHDQTNLELSHEVCARVAEDASYKLWELINNVKIYARHSGGVVTYDLVNEVLKDTDVPPALGAMDSDWERVDYDGSYFYYSDKILELRDEYQREVTLSMPNAPDFRCSWPIDSKHVDQLKVYIPNLIYVALYGNYKARQEVLMEAATTQLMGVSYRLIVTKIVHTLSFKQLDDISQRCWRLLRACNFNPFNNNVCCREEYFHLAEVLISQLLAPCESIKVHDIKTEPVIKMEINDNNNESEVNTDIQSEGVQQHGVDYSNVNVNINDGENTARNKNCLEYHLVTDEDEIDDTRHPPEYSPFFASPVTANIVDELCETIGELAAHSGYFHDECIHLIMRRLKRFFEGREICTDRDYKYISRVVRGLLALGEYAFREFIPYIYKLKVDEIPDSLWQDFIPSAIFLNGRDDIFLYEWLEYGCGADKLQPFMVHYALTHEKNLIRSSLAPKSNFYKICSVTGVRRLEWSTVAAAMCLGDDPSKALKPKPTLQDVFPDIVKPNLQLNRSGTIRFKFTGCRPVLLKPKAVDIAKNEKSPPTNGGVELGHTDILIARRKLLKPLTNLRLAVPLCSYHYTTIN